MGDTYRENDEAESWFYSYEGWVNRPKNEANPNNPDGPKRDYLESAKPMEPEHPDDLNSVFLSQSFLTGEADLLEVEQLGKHIALKIYKGGIMGQSIRLTLNAREARTLIMMLATAVEGGPFESKEPKDFGGKESF